MGPKFMTLFPTGLHISRNKIFHKKLNSNGFTLMNNWENQNLVKKKTTNF